MLVATLKPFFLVETTLKLLFLIVVVTTLTTLTTLDVIKSLNLSSALLPTLSVIVNTVSPLIVLSLNLHLNSLFALSKLQENTSLPVNEPS